MIARHVLTEILGSLNTASVSMCWRTGLPTCITSPPQKKHIILEYWSLVSEETTQIHVTWGQWNNGNEGKEAVWLKEVKYLRPGPKSLTSAASAFFSGWVVENILFFFLSSFLATQLHYVINRGKHRCPFPVPFPPHHHQSFQSARCWGPVSPDKCLCVYKTVLFLFYMLLGMVEEIHM